MPTWIGRLLLLLATVVLIANPVTQHLWTWDRFLHGGHDFETNLLLIVAALCLLILLAHRNQPNAGLRINVCWRSACRLDAAEREKPNRGTREGCGSIFPGAVCNLPLLI